MGRRGQLAYGLYMAAFIVVLGYGLWVAIRSQRAYAYLKNPRPGFSGKIHRFDPELGYAAIPGASGARTFPIGPSLPVRYDRQGFRIPAHVSPERELRRPLVLALGCSYTFGDACLAEDTYPELVARGLGGTSVNAGKCAYGLAQMLLLARRLIPEHRPEYVLLQHSPWLVTRGLSGFGRSALARSPAPYFYRAADGLHVHPPVFRGTIFDLPVVDYESTPRSLPEAISFFWRVGLPVFVHDDLGMLGYRWRRWRGTLPAPATDPDAVVREAYREIAGLCEREGSRLVLVRLAQALDQPSPMLEGVATRRGQVLIARAQERLNQAVSERSEEGYEARFGHWRGSPPVFVDPHPNPQAHRIIAETVLEAIRKAEADARP